MFDNNLKFCRENLNMTQEELGNKLNVSRKTICNWEMANDPIPILKLVEFCNLYNYSLDYVTGLTNENNKHYNKININKKEIANRLKVLRKSLKLNQTRFAKKCGLPQQTYSNYETGLNLITTTNLYAICKTYNISMDYLLGGTIKEKQVNYS